MILFTIIIFHFSCRESGNLSLPCKVLLFCLKYLARQCGKPTTNVCGSIEPLEIKNGGGTSSQHITLIFYVSCDIQNSCNSSPVSRQSFRFSVYLWYSSFLISCIGFSLTGITLSKVVSPSVLLIPTELPCPSPTLLLHQVSAFSSPRKAFVFPSSHVHWLPFAIMTNI